MLNDITKRLIRHAAKSHGIKLRLRKKYWTRCHVNKKFVLLNPNKIDLQDAIYAMARSITVYHERDGAREFTKNRDLSVKRISKCIVHQELKASGIDTEERDPESLAMGIDEAEMIGMDQETLAHLRSIYNSHIGDLLCPSSTATRNTN